MNRAKLKNYAPQARREFIQAVTDRAAYHGLTPKKNEPIIEKGDVALIGGRAFPRSVVQKRRGLEERISRHGFEQVMEAMRNLSITLGHLSTEFSVLFPRSQGPVSAY
jgi:hypothetical protein